MKTVILISGKKQSGKNTFVDFMSHSLNGKGYSVCFESIAQPMKDYAKADFDALASYLRFVADSLETRIFTMFNLTSDPAFENFAASIKKGFDLLRIKDENWYENKTDLTRMLLQIYGTNIIQNRIDVNFWDNRVKKVIESTKKDFIFVTDVRWPSNIETLSSSKWRTFVIRIDRKSVEIKDSHPSETALDKYNGWSYVIENDGTLAELKSAAQNVANDIVKSL
jgi:hypothetical protein